MQFLKSQYFYWCWQYQFIAAICCSAIYWFVSLTVVTTWRIGCVTFIDIKTFETLQCWIWIHDESRETSTIEATFNIETLSSLFIVLKWVTQKVYHHGWKYTILKLKSYDHVVESIRSFDWKYTICNRMRSFNFEIKRLLIWKYNDCIFYAPMSLGSWSYTFDKRSYI